MKNVLKFVAFLVYTIIIFQIRNFKILGALFVINSLFALILKIQLKNIWYAFKIFLPFILFTVIVNIIFSSLQEGILIGVRILICYYTTYIYAKTVSISEIADTIEKFFYPLKIFKIDTKQIRMIVSIALCMIPVLKNEMITLKNTMKSRGQNWNVRNSIILLKPMMISILRKTNEMEKTLISRGIQ